MKCSLAISFTVRFSSWHTYSSGDIYNDIPVTPAVTDEQRPGMRTVDNKSSPFCHRASGTAVSVEKIHLR
ncbi:MULTISPECIES: hypothetical protein [Enterobacteriaceae]|uniref:Secreted protein n=2 Tax=Enterobacteriaceae TaxID=543 RepID=A0ABW1Q923_9ENTR|nr:MULTISPECIES: hypothetical protein [Phytobacter]MDU4153628.1 hypothetical protein [Enterobacteriaceae bacterium]MDU7379571.1 hypothetical protein [Enterobacteriaceae bacterium]MDV2903710.1 hypothetical protein [Phytobacter diazotrophicus]BBE80452.1 hypothetical protein MRY16398_55080 [Phytobacter sp. MRY16-398]BDD53772.1 hypothetical protein PDTA9734_52590 [Phytobacter diazotrophicus]